MRRCRSRKRWLTLRRLIRNDHPSRSMRACAKPVMEWIPAVAAAAFMPGLRCGNYSVIRVGKLQFVESRVGAAPCEKLLMRAYLGDRTVFEDNNLVRAANRRKAVRDNECRAPHHQIRQRALYEHFGFGVEFRSGLV